MSKAKRIRRTRNKNEEAKAERREAIRRSQWRGASRRLRNRSKYRPGVNVKGYRRSQPEESNE